MFFFLLVSMSMVNGHVINSHKSRDVRTQCSKVVCADGQECRVAVTCVGQGCLPKPVCAKVWPYVDEQCPNTTLAVLAPAAAPPLKSTRLDQYDDMEAMTCLDMTECPEGSVCIFDNCCYD
ncbi:uncharacterized protein LOC131953632 [Physella acuta]|uniref:uncharacterized protein LOC131953632 n=1 Tax=Physella acuta TaxID=109671 RepID=UPI0027DE6F83|nr:uncharacterized protein LOC131953632 [Physella acuta]